MNRHRPPTGPAYPRSAHFCPLAGAVELPQDLNRELLQHLGFEVAFDETPNPKASEAVERLGPNDAAACSDQILKSGGAGILYWATPESIRAMLETRWGSSFA